MSNLPEIITIDNETTIDRDDGISYNSEKNILWIHITLIRNNLNNKNIMLLPDGNSYLFYNYEIEKIIYKFDNIDINLLSLLL